MEPNHETTPSAAELPMPVALNSDTEASAERIAPSPEASSAPSVPSTQITQSDATNASAQLAAQQAPIASQPIASADDETLIADDADLIEKEWIVRAKAIVSRTSADPHVQNKELNKMKAEYIKKRYNKDIQVDKG